MKLRNLLTASVLVASSSTAFAGAVDFTEVMSNAPTGSGRGVSCSASLNSHSDVSSRFQSNLLPSATNVEMNGTSCLVGSLGYSASNNLFSQKPQMLAEVAQFARFSLIDDSSLLMNKTVLQAAVTK